MDDETEAAFAALGLINEATDEQFAAERAATEATVAALELKYADRGLKFTQIFSGACPVQAYGHIDGERFYFRFRSNWGQLKVGPYDLEIEEKTYLRGKEQHDKRVREADERLAAGEIDTMDYMWLTTGSSRDEMVLESNPRFYPTRITKASAVEGDNPDDIYNGSLDEDESFAMFSNLANTLQSVPDEEQISKTTQLWLDGGSDAVNAYFEAQRPALKAKIVAEQAAKAENAKIIAEQAEK